MTFLTTDLISFLSCSVSAFVTKDDSFRSMALIGTSLRKVSSMEIKPLSVIGGEELVVAGGDSGVVVGVCWVSAGPIPTLVAC